MDKIYDVYMMLGNFSHLVFSSDNFYEVQDYLEQELLDSGIDIDDEAEVENFYSYYSISER